MVEPEKSLDLQLQECLESLGIRSLGDWDVLVFLYHHHACLASVEQIARLVSYPNKVAGEALGTLESLGLVKRSRDSQGLRLYQFVRDPPQSCFSKLMSVAENRNFPVSSIVDNIILLSLVEIDNKFRRAISVAKARGCNHEFDTREFTIGQGGISLMPPDPNAGLPALPLESYSSVLSRAPTRVLRHASLGTPSPAGK
ncbi:MAG: ATPase domain-containing protein [Bryobacteraceae bacterium]